MCENDILGDVPNEIITFGGALKAKYLLRTTQNMKFDTQAFKLGC